VERPRLPEAAVTLEAHAAEAGTVASVDARAVGLAVVALGGGRMRETDEIDHAVGLTEVAGLGEHVGPGERPLALVHARTEEDAQRAATALREAYTLGEAPAPEPIVLEILR
jgi:thymidine phosphorylase